MLWLEAFQKLCADKASFVMVTVTAVRGHAPRAIGAKMLVTAKEVFGSVGGGKLEHRAINTARAKMSRGEVAPLVMSVKLNQDADACGVQCCGGEVTLFLEHVQAKRKQVAIFGAGHVGWALTQILSILPIDLHLIDSRLEQLELQELAASAQMTLYKHHEVVPEVIVERLPCGSHVLVLTHDHAEDIAILDKVLARADLGFVGLIGSSTKWSHFQQRLKEQGHSETTLAKVTTPIGITAITGKSPQVIAIATAAQLLPYLEIPESDL